jgi:hypothetical protein
MSHLLPVTCLSAKHTEVSPCKRNRARIGAASLHRSRLLLPAESNSEIKRNELHVRTLAEHVMEATL